ncbi:MAG: DNA-directed RNA polymerase subunit H [Candidatus Thermoplasmatota archaeon]|nr:DNA-directed RNA polymerase subunit H [Euryarchaeota archaeon]MBU4072289.1 DNA-directed RNA polymerase subunit H [Candidatus Thermoplasmatota archaeon]MBU4144671.1 DNA-directed RNA polymerase subunit H [Candidatus Thermoplasmatota archaeon]MBU4592524.1 DNA-directed RNA polymerase subunit H [Candidatus Thermoplasmatota archaeon]
MADYNVLEHDHVPEHHLVEKKDEGRILKQYSVGKDQLPKIRKSDPCIKILEEILGADIEEGRLVRIVRTHSVSGVSVAYRVIVRG